MSIIIGKALIAGGGTVDRLDFTYTGQYNERLEDGVVELLTSGVITFKKETPIDVFMVGGGSSGNSGRTTQPDSDADGSGGGAGGYTKTLLNIIPRARQGYQVIIGSGGAEQTSNLSFGNAGGTTSAFGSSVSGGAPKTTARNVGGDGGSGGGQGGARAASTQAGRAGGVDGGNGGYYDAAGSGGTGQGTTTREFGESTGKLYAGGGGGGSSNYTVVGSTNGGNGGGGGGGNGAGYSANATAGTPNTGGGGGGGAGKTTSSSLERGVGAAGGSGIVCIRLHKESEVPELAGTWVLNDTLNPALNTINETVAFSATTPGGSFNGVKIGVGSTGTTTATFYLNASTIYTTYQFSNNSWVDSSRKITQITFATGATASDEFMTWLVANATKTS